MLHSNCNCAVYAATLYPVPVILSRHEVAIVIVSRQRDEAECRLHFLRTRVVYATSARRFANQRTNQRGVFVVAAAACHSAGVNYHAYPTICTTKRPQKCHYISVYI